MDEYISWNKDSCDLERITTLSSGYGDGDAGDGTGNNFNYDIYELYLIFECGYGEQSISIEYYK